MSERTERAVLNHLIETCRDAELGFRTAAHHVADPNLSALFKDIADHRGRSVLDLEPHARRLGGPAAAEGTHAGALHRHWIDLKSMLPHEDDAIVKEVERGNRVTVRVFKDAVNGMLPPDTRELVEALYAEALRTEHEIAAALA